MYVIVVIKYILLLTYWYSDANENNYVILSMKRENSKETVWMKNSKFSKSEHM